MGGAVARTNLVAIAADIEREFDLAQRTAATAVEHAIEVGKLLVEAKALVAHGQWIPWIEENCEFTAKTAQNYMRLASNTKRVSHLPVRQALEVIAEHKPKPRPAPEPEEFMEQDGESDEPTVEVVAPTAKGANGRVAEAPNRPIVDRDEGETVARPKQSLSNEKPLRKEVGKPRIEDAPAAFREAWEAMKRQVVMQKKERWRQLPQEHCRHFIQVLEDLAQ